MSKHIKNKVPKMTEQDYNNYLMSLKDEEPFTFDNDKINNDN